MAVKVRLTPNVHRAPNGVWWIEVAEVPSGGGLPPLDWQCVYMTSGAGAEAKARAVHALLEKKPVEAARILAIPTLAARAGDPIFRNVGPPPTIADHIYEMRDTA